MSGSNFLKKLLDGSSLEPVPLGRIGTILRGTSITEKETTPGDYPVVANGPSHNYYHNQSNRTGETIVIARSGAYAGLVSYWDIPIFLTDAFSIQPQRSLVRPKYLYYALKKDQIKIHNMGKGAGVPHVRATDFELYEIPIPCPGDPMKSLEIQGEIVRILDTFSELTAALTAALTAELTARKKQYDYYRDQLLSFEDGEVEWKTLGDVTIKSYSGSTPTAGNPKYYDGGTIPWLRTQEVKFTDIDKTDIKITPAALKDTAAKWIPANCVIVAISGATAGRCAVNKIPLTTNQHCCCLEIDSKQALYRFVFHWVSLNYESIKGLGQGARGDLNSGIIKGFKIPIPYPNEPEKSLAEQARIVGILDKFDTLTSSITEGLPREIELRQKQYEYYRDLLLSFPTSEKDVA